MAKIKEVIHEFMSPESNLFVYSLSFGILLSLAPALIVFATLFRWGTFLDIRVVLEFLEQMHLPYEIQEQVELIFFEFMNKEYGFVPAVSTLCVSFWLASRSINSFLLISANHEKVNVMKFAIRLQSIFMFIVFAIILVSGIIFATFVYHVVPHSWLSLLAAGIMVPLFTLMYRSLSFRKRSLSFGLIGGLFSTSALILLVYFSFLLIQRMITYNRIYGSLASLVALLLVIYIISCIIYIGYLLNVVFEETYQKEDQLPMKHMKYYLLCEKWYKKIPFLSKLRDL